MNTMTTKAGGNGWLWLLAVTMVTMTSLVQMTSAYSPELSKRFLRFGRALTDDHFLRFGRPMDKRFLRFGRADPDLDVDLNSEIEDMLWLAIARAQASQDNSPVYIRKKRSALVQPDGPLPAEAGEGEEQKKRFMRFGRGADDDSSDAVMNDKRFMRFGKRFMRFGRSNEDDEEENVDLENDKRFMRFGKRFMRFGRGDETDEHSQNKRFMRFGKRFMRFGRDHQDTFDEDDNKDKRFMRFGKRFMRFGRGGADEGDSLEQDKRFMRFGKRFMRFGREPEKRFMRFGRDSQASNDDNVEGEKAEDKRFMRFGKRFMRFGKRADQSSEGHSEQATS